MAKWRPNPDFYKQLKPWRLGRVRKGWMEITCPHCGGVAYVKRGRWLHRRSNYKYIGRSCTYCFKTGRIPVPEWKKEESGR